MTKVWRSIIGDFRETACQRHNKPSSSHQICTHSEKLDAPNRVHEGRSSLSAGQCQLLLCFASLRALLAAHIENISPG